jgi:hypothetical protein
MWVVLTRTNPEGPVHVNMELVTYMWHSTTHHVTEIVFGTECSIRVKETPEEIRDRLASLIDFEADPNENG